MSKSCVICGGEESENELLIGTPCGRHFVCPDDVASFFERATSNESLFPPKCCEQIFLLEEYEDYVPFEISWAYQMKEQGEYAILAKFRVYCANQPCAKFLHPASQIEDPDTKITYAICENEDCGKLTCCSCKTLLEHGTQNHDCHQNEDEKKFKETANKKGYQECFVCGATVELAEACNHITCGCGHQFCYICGKDWSGLHGCPHYGPVEYDEEGYNQDGFHRDTGLNRQGLNRRQEMARLRGEENPDEDEDGEEDERDPEWEVLQHIDAAQREIINQLPRHEREDALDNLRIMLHDTQGIIFDQGQGQAQNFEDHGEEDDESDNSDDDEPPHIPIEPNDEQDGNAANEEHRNPEGNIGLFVDRETPETAQIADNQPNHTFNPRVPQAMFDPLFDEVDGEPHHAEPPEGRASSSSASDDILPATPMDIDDPLRDEESKERERLDGNQAPPQYGVEE